jgi:hypothetical protein
VSSTILMAIVLVVMWLVVLVPMFVNRGEERVQSRSMDRFATAMRVLSRRAPSSGGIAGRRRYVTAPPVPYADGSSPVRAAARARMMRRRRRTLTVLVATVLVGLPAAMVVSSWFWVAQVPAVIMLAGYVGWLRQQVRRERERRTRRQAMFADPAAPAAEHAARRTAAAAADEPAEDRTWRPTAVPTPSYVLAPAVRRRTESMIDLDDDDPTFVDLDDEFDLPRAANE